MPFGYLISVGVMATYTLIALALPRPRTSSPFRLSFWLGFLVNELPFSLSTYSLPRPHWRSFKAERNRLSSGRRSASPSSPRLGLCSSSGEHFEPLRLSTTPCTRA
jgi:hypothetical protein